MFWILKFYFILYVIKQEGLYIYIYMKGRLFWLWIITDSLKMTITVWLHWLITFNENHRLCVLATGVWILLMWRPFHGYVFPQFLPADGGVAVFERVRLSQHFRPSLRLRREFRWVCKWLDSVLFSVVIMVANNVISKPFIISLMWNTNKSMFLNCWTSIPNLL